MSDRLTDQDHDASLPEVYLPRVAAVTGRRHSDLAARRCPSAAGRAAGRRPHGAEIPCRPHTGPIGRRRVGMATSFSVSPRTEMMAIEVTTGRIFNARAPTPLSDIARHHRRRRDVSVVASLLYSVRFLVRSRACSTWKSSRCPGPSLPCAMPSGRRRPFLSGLHHEYRWVPEAACW